MCEKVEWEITLTLTAFERYELRATTVPSEGGFEAALTSTPPMIRPCRQASSQF